MSPITHAFHTTFRRFRWEILAFWLLSAAVVAGFSRGLIRAPSPLEYPPVPRVAFDRLEWIAMAWIILRLMASDPILLTMGGWRTRPISRLAVWCAPFAVLAITLLPPFLLRVLVIQQAVAPDIIHWLAILTRGFLPALGWISLVALTVRAGGPLVTRHGAGRKIRFLFGLLCMLAIGAWFHPATAFTISRFIQAGRPYRSGGGSLSFGSSVLGIQELLPPGGKYVGDWTMQSPPAVRRREIFRFPLKPGLVLHGAGIRMDMKRIRPEGRRLDLAFDLIAADPALIRDLWSGTMVLRYAGSSYAFRRQSSDWQEESPVSILPLTTIHCISDFDSPIGYLWNDQTWEELLSDAELMIFVPDKSRPPIDFIRKIEPPKLVRQFSPGLAGEVEALFDGLDTDYEHTKEMTAKGAAFPPQAMSHILERHPWSDSAWDGFVRPFLLEHAEESDKAALLDRMANEPRLGEIMVAKGWKAEAMPLLRRFAADRLPLDAESLAALVQERDPALAGDLAALSARLDTGLEKLEPLARGNPGFDWKAFVEEGWHRRKYSFRRNGPIEPFNFWAAQEGDFSAFHYTAEQAARGISTESGEIEKLVAGEHSDLIAYLRENIDRMKYDPMARKWGM